MNQNSFIKKEVIISIGLILLFSCTVHAELLAHWRFEEVAGRNGNRSASVVGESLSSGGGGGGRRGASASGSPYVWDDTGKGNFLQVNGQSPNVFSDDVSKAQVYGKPNTRSLALKRGEFIVNMDRPLSYYDMRKNWTIEASLKCNLLGTEQVYLCKEGAAGQLSGGDVSIGFDNMRQKYFVEVMGTDGKPYRIVAGNPVEAGQWYDIRANAVYDIQSKKTKLELEVKPSKDENFGKPVSITFEGPALRRDAGMWIIGRGYPGGFPNALQVLDGAIDEIKITGEALPRVPGQNPLFTNTFTADPAALVQGDTVYLYVGHDTASPGGWFNMPEWLCYSTKDMKNWTAHGPVLAAKDFVNANQGAAWAAQVVEKEGKYYFYATLDCSEGHFITVAVSDSPTGPFKEALPGKPLITDKMTTDSHRANSDIDPTVLIDDDGTPWMAWGNGDCYFVKLKQNMTEIDGPITKVPYRNFSEGPWLFKRGDIYYNVYAADAPGVQPEQICYSTSPKITGPWTYGGFITGPANHGFTIHPSVIEFKNQWYFFYHDGSYSLNGGPGGDCRRSVCLEYLYFNEDGTIKPITLTADGIYREGDPIVQKVSFDSNLPGQIPAVPASQSQDSVQMGDWRSFPEMKLDIPIAPGPFEPTWESIEKNYPGEPAWLREAKFGIWVHFGPQSAGESGDWYARKLYSQGTKANQNHLKKYGHPSEVGYKEVLRDWNPTKLDPAALTKIYHDAGARFLMIQGVHHDNFDLWNSHYQPWNSVNIGPKRDLIGEWAKACRTDGMRFGVTFHHEYTWWWWQTAFGSDNEGDKMGIPYDGNLTLADGKGKWWEGLDPRLLYGINLREYRGVARAAYTDWSPAPAGIFTNHLDYAKWYVTQWALRMMDVVDQYDPDFIYTDGTVQQPFSGNGTGTGIKADAMQRVIADFYNSALERRGKVDTFSIVKFRDKTNGTVTTEEHGIPANINTNEPWIAEAPVGDWFYAPGFTYDSGMMIRYIIEAVSRDGNASLCISILPDGSLDEGSLQMLKEVGVWMRRNGEAVYGSRAWKIPGEGELVNSRLKMLPGGKLGRNHANFKFSPQDFRFTIGKNGSLYAFCMTAPSPGTQLKIKSLGTDAKQLDQPVKTVKLLGYNGELQWKQEADSLEITYPAEISFETSIVFEIE